MSIEAETGWVLHQGFAGPQIDLESGGYAQARLSSGEIRRRRAGSDGDRRVGDYGPSQQ